MITTGLRPLTDEDRHLREHEADAEARGLRHERRDREREMYDFDEEAELREVAAMQRADEEKAQWDRYQDEAESREAQCRG